MPVFGFDYLDDVGSPFTPQTTLNWQLARRESSGGVGDSGQLQPHQDAEIHVPTYLTHTQITHVCRHAAMLPWVPVGGIATLV